MRFLIVLCEQYAFFVYLWRNFMPYITQEDRKALNSNIESLADIVQTRGELNYAITKLIHHYINKNNKKYDTLNDAIGILECAKLELYRHIVGPYEDTKIDLNGDVGVLSK